MNVSRPQHLMYCVAKWGRPAANPDTSLFGRSEVDFTGPHNWIIPRDNAFENSPPSWMKGDINEIAF